MEYILYFFPFITSYTASKNDENVQYTSAMLIQSVYRMHSDRVRYTNISNKISKIQKWYRTHKKTKPQKKQKKIKNKFKKKSFAHAPKHSFQL